MAVEPRGHATEIDRCLEWVGAKHGFFLALALNAALTSGNTSDQLQLIKDNWMMASGRTYFSLKRAALNALWR